MKFGFVGVLFSLMIIGGCASNQADDLPSSSSILEGEVRLQGIGELPKPKNKLEDALAGLEPKNGDSGLLLSFDTDTSQNRKGYAQFYDFDKPETQEVKTNKTIYLTRVGNQIQLVAKMDYIASPQKSGFIYAGQVRYLEKPRIEKCGYRKCSIGFDYSRVWVATSKQAIRPAKEAAIAQIGEIIDKNFMEQGEASQDVTDYET